jgi:ribokinase
MSVFVCGSLHLDVIVEAPGLPRLDETVVGAGVRYAFGGKGGNQAVAAARMGAATAMAGRVGGDAFGATLLAGLADADVDADAIQRDDGASGMSVAIIRDDGGYGAVIVSAANLRIDPDRITVPETARVVVLQNEVPEAVNLAVARKARGLGAAVILNAAPARAVSRDLLAATDLLVVNRVEAADMLGIADIGPDLPGAAVALSALGPRAVIVTLGGDGLVLLEDGGLTTMPALAVNVVSTHGAGDAFLGALAAELDRGETLADACRFGIAAAALHVSASVEARSAIMPDDVRAALAQADMR